MRLILGRILGRNDELVSVLARHHPLAYPRLRLLVLIAIGRVDKVASSCVVCIEELKRLLGSGGAYAGDPARPCGGPRGTRRR